MEFVDGHLVIMANQHAAIVQIGQIAITWYGLAYAAGFAIGWSLLKKMLDSYNPPITDEHDFGDLFFWIFLGVVVGGRLGYILFYGDIGHYIANPLDLLKIWEGGMSYHGGAFGVLLAIFFFAWSSKVSAIRILDYVAVVQPAGQFLGRIANFINGELWGAPTDASWGVIFRGADAIDTPRHPTQLYEAATEGLLLFVLLNFLFWKTGARNRPGLLAGLYITLYAIFRFAIEFVRVPDIQLAGQTGPLTMGQWLCLPMLALGAILLIRSFARPAMTERS